MTSPADYFEILGTFGSPSPHAIVGRGRELSTGKEFAVKMRRQGDQIERRFTREVEAMRAAAGFHVMPIADVDEDGEWYSMPIASGELTGHLLEIPENEREELALSVVRAVADGLRGFHLDGRVHRDLKPQNILWLEDDHGERWVVSDFGIARNAPGTTTAELTRDGSLVGTEQWAAPEQHTEAHAATPHTDAYSLGAIVGWIMTGELPSPFSVPLPNRRFRAVVSRATRREQEQRYGSLDEMLFAMENAEDAERGPLSSQLDQVLTEPYDVRAAIDFALAHRENSGLLLPELHRFPETLIAEWFATDPGGLAQFLESMCDHLRGTDTGGLTQSGLRPPLFWALNVLRLLVRKRRFDLAEQAGIPFFAAAESCNQFPVGDAIAKWLKGLSDDRAMQAMLNAIAASSSGAYVRSILEHDWGRFSSDVLRRWLL